MLVEVFFLWIMVGIIRLGFFRYIVVFLGWFLLLIRGFLYCFVSLLLIFMRVKLVKDVKLGIRMNLYFFNFIKLLLFFMYVLIFLLIIWKFVNFIMFLWFICVKFLRVLYLFGFFLLCIIGLFDLKCLV